MKELTKKILEAGLVDKHLAQMMEKWGALEPGATDLVGKERVTKETLERFAEDIASLVNVDGPVKETLLDAKVSNPVLFHSNGIPPFQGAWDEMGRLLVGATVQLVPGNIILELPDSTRARRFRILEITPVYVGEQSVGQLATVEPL